MKRSATWKTITRDKAALRRKAAAASFSEKLRVVERLRERDAAIKRARGRGRTATRKK